MNYTYIEHLQAIVRIPTISNKNENLTDWHQFEKLHNFLKTAYPTIHSRMEKIHIGKAGLLFHLRSQSSKKLPVLLMAHQDVVPAGDESKWTHRPFSGDLADGCLWGRGSGDCKSLLIAECEAVEELLKSGFEPDYDLYLSFGHNEEVQANNDIKGAALTAKYLKDHAVKIGCIFDEGGKVFRGVDFGDSTDTARVALAEKAPNGIILYKDSVGGHASKPGKGTALGAVARAIAAVEANPLPYRLTPLIRSELQALAPLQRGERRKIFSHPDRYWDALCTIARDDRELDALLHTTFAATMASGSPQANILPPHAECTLNVRILQGDTVESVKSYLESIIPEDVKIRVTFGQDPQLAGGVHSDEFRLLTNIIHEVFGNDTAVIPTELCGATDSRYFSTVCDHIFRFSGRYFTKDWGEAHQIDEKVPLNVVEKPVIFFKRFLEKYNET